MHHHASENQEEKLTMSASWNWIFNLNFSWQQNIQTYQVYILKLSEQGIWDFRQPFISSLLSYCYPVKEGMGGQNCPTPRERHNQPGSGEQGSVRLCEAKQKRAEIDSLNAAVIMSLWHWYHVQNYNTTVVLGYFSWPHSSGTSIYRHYCTSSFYWAWLSCYLLWTWIFQLSCDIRD